MLVEKNVPLQPYNSFHIVAKAFSLVRVTQVTDLQEVLADPIGRASPSLCWAGAATSC
jgi:UDP-N-acetylmuramate dehydrogenase